MNSTFQIVASRPTWYNFQPFSQRETRPRWDAGNNSKCWERTAGLAILLSSAISPSYSAVAANSLLHASLMQSSQWTGLDWIRGDIQSSPKVHWISGYPSQKPNPVQWIRLDRKSIPLRTLVWCRGNLMQYSLYRASILWREGHFEQAVVFLCILSSVYCKLLLKESPLQGPSGFRKYTFYWPFLAIWV